MRTAPENAIFTQNFAMSATPGLVMVILAFHLFVVGTVIFVSVLLCQVKTCQELLYSFKGKCGATHKATKTV